MAEDVTKKKIKKVLADVGEVLAGRGTGGKKLVVLRCAKIEQTQTAIRLLPKAFPRIKWKGIAASSAPLKAVLQIAAEAGRSGKLVTVLYDFPGELDNRAMDDGVAEDLNDAAKSGGFLDVPVLLAICPGTVRVLAGKAPDLWKNKGGYFAWPSEVPEESDYEGRPPEHNTAYDEDLGESPPEPEETKKVLESLVGEDAAEYLIKVSRTHLQGGDAEQARLFLLRAVQIFSESANLDGMASAYCLLGVGAQQRGDYDTALEWFEQGVDNLRILDDKGRLSEAIGQKGYVYYLRGQYESAVKAFQEGLAIDKELGLKDREAAGYRKIAMVLELTRKFAAAEDLYRKSLELEEARSNMGGVARVYHHLGRLMELQENFDGALEQYQLSLEIKEKENDHSGIATTYHQMGNLHLARCEFDEAVVLYQKALAVEKEQRDRQGLARTSAQLGLTYREQGRIEESLLYLMRAYQTFQKLRSPVASEVLAKVEEIQDLVPAETFNKILREASLSSTSV